MFLAVCVHKIQIRDKDAQYMSSLPTDVLRKMIARQGLRIRSQERMIQKLGGNYEKFKELESTEVQVDVKTCLIDEMLRLGELASDISDERSKEVCNTDTSAKENDNDTDSYVTLSDASFTTQEDEQIEGILQIL